MAIAFFWYVVCMLGYAVMPAIALVNIMLQEAVVLGRMPESEDLYAVGQWAPLYVQGLLSFLLLSYDGATQSRNLMGKRS